MSGAVNLGVRLVIATALAFAGSLAYVGAAHADDTYAISGTVVGNADAPLNGVIVTAYDAGDSIVAQVSSVAGAFELIVPPGTYKITFDPTNAGDYKDKTINGVVVTNAAVSLGQVKLEAYQYGTLNVQVSGGGNPLPDMQVYFEHVASGVNNSGFTNQQGLYEGAIDTFRAGDWNVSVSDPQGVYAPAQTVVTVAAGATALGSVTMVKIPKGTMSGTVTNEADVPLSSVSVTARDIANNQFYSASTGGDGKFAFVDLPVGGYELTFVATGYQQKVVPGPFNVATDQDTAVGVVKLDHIPEGTITGTLSDGAGTPAQSLEIRAVETTTGTHLFAYSDANGAFTLPAAPGTYDVTITDYGEDWVSMALANPVTVVDQQTTALGAITLAKQVKGTIAGTVLGPDGPMEGAFVNLYRFVDGVASFHAVVATDVDGKYSFANQFGGFDYTVEASATGFFSKVLGGGTDPNLGTHVTISNGQTTDVAPITLAKIPVVNGVVKTATGPILGAAVYATTPAGDIVTTYTDDDGKFSLLMEKGPGVVMVENAFNVTPFGFITLNNGQPLGASTADLGNITVSQWTALGSDQLADTLGIPRSQVVNTSYTANFRAAQIGREQTLDFPRQGDDYLMLSSGWLRPLKGSTQTFYSTETEDGGGVDGNDLSQVSLTLKPPADADCLAFDFRFMSEEFPEYVGSTVNDTFTADVKTTDWTLNGSQLVAPNNFAYDLSGKPVSVNTTGFEAIPGLVFDGTTPLLRASTPVEVDLNTGNMKVILSVQDLGDSIFDSAAIIDNFEWIKNVDNCAAGSVALTDSDGDGLSDVWETNGIDYNGDGTPELDLPALGADPMHQDIFLEIDWMEKAPTCTWYLCSGGLSFAPQRTAVADVVAAFAAAPHENPDGTKGINLHVDTGFSSPNVGAGTWGDATGANSVPHKSILGTYNGAYSWNEFNDIKAANFDPLRRDAFHYVLYADKYQGSTSSACPAGVCSSGISRGIPGGDLIVTDGHSSWGDGFTRTQERGTLMHELGHNLSLYHGGGPTGTGQGTVGYKSIMNYRYQLVGIGDTNTLDYSRIDTPYHDWNNIRFDGGSVGDLGDTAPPIETSESDSIDPATAKAADAFAKDGDATLSFEGPTVVLPDTGQRDLFFDVVNAGDTPQAYTVTVTSAAFPGQTLTATATVPGASTGRFEVPVNTTGLAIGEHQLTAKLSTPATPNVSETSGSFTAPDMSDPAEQAAAAAAVDELEGSDQIDPDVLEQFNDMVEEATMLMNTVAPSITGNVRVGETVTATDGTWDPAATSYTYRWLADGTAIAGATNKTYPIVAADLGKDLVVEVTAKKDGNLDGVAMSAASEVAIGTAPTATPGPSFTGIAKVGQTLTAVDGTWSRPGVTLTREWFSGPNVVGTGPTYTVVPADVGAMISLKVKATQTGFEQGVATSGSTLVTQGDAPTTTVLPSITGTAAKDSTLTALPGEWTAPDLEFDFQWLRAGAEIDGATASTYKIVTADLGKGISVRVTAVRAGFVDGVATSAVVTPPVPKATSTTKGKVKGKVTSKKAGTITVTVTRTGGGAATGAVTIAAGAKVLKTGTLSASNKGIITIKLPRLKKGTYPLTISYAGDSKTLASKGTLTLKVKKAKKKKKG